MAETNTASDQEFLEDGVTKNPDYKAPDDGGEGGKPADPPQKAAGEGEEPEVPIRSSASQVIARQKRTIDKLRSKDEEDKDADFEPPTGEEDLTPEAQGAVSREVQRQVAPLVEGIAGKSDEDELQVLFNGTDGESAKPYEKQIRAYMKVHPTATPDMIYHHLAFGKAETTGAGKKNTANTDAANQQGGGSGVRPEETDGSGLPSIEEQDAMSDEEHEAIRNKALQGGFKEKE